MHNLIESQPTFVRCLADSALFYFGTHTLNIYALPGKAQFQIVHSPVEPYGWEFVRYQWFEEKNGLSILERRPLEPDEITHFERLLAQAKSKEQRFSSAGAF